MKLKVYNCIAIHIEDHYDVDNDSVVKLIARCTNNWQKGRFRRDAVLVGDADGDGNGLDRFEVAQLCLLFKFYYDRNESTENREAYELAYVQWFRKKPRHDINYMVIVELTDKFDVISVDDIYRPMHLIPKFEIAINLRTTTANRVDAEKYREFYVNSYIDYHAYNNCY